MKTKEFETLSEKITGKQLHKWYLEVTKLINPKSFNRRAQKPYEKLTEEQQKIDDFIAEKINQNIKEFIKILLNEFELDNWQREDLIKLAGKSLIKELYKQPSCKKNLMTIKDDVNKEVKITDFNKDMSYNERQYYGEYFDENR